MALAPFDALPPSRRTARSTPAAATQRSAHAAVLALFCVAIATNPVLDGPLQGVMSKLAHDCAEELARLKGSHPEPCVAITESNGRQPGDIPDQIQSIERSSITFN